MTRAQTLIRQLREGQHDDALRALYGEDGQRLAAQRNRYIDAIYQFEAAFGAGRELALFSTPGRTEIGGNHTDHNHGIVMAAAVDLDIIAVVAKRDDAMIRVKSHGFAGVDEVALDALEADAGEFGKSSALIRGVAAAMKARGGEIGGFDAYTDSDVLKGSGLSSSAAFEVCIGCVLNEVYNKGRFSAVQLGMMGQYAENVFFGKPSGLMDQTACAVGGVMTIDLKDPAAPVVDKIPLELARHQLALVITDTKGSHANLTDDYAAVRTDMERVAAHFGKAVLREVPFSTFLGAIPAVRTAVGDRAVLRAIHFYSECERAKALAKSLEKEDMAAFLRLVVAGGHSSFEYNQNAYSLKHPQEQGVPVGLALSQTVLDGKGAWRLQGGGFAGTIQAFVPFDLLEKYCALLNGAFGPDSAHVLTVRNAGCVCLAR
ncbi:MAG: galactokinase [Oscillospiraceae bacterium]